MRLAILGFFLLLIAMDLVPALVAVARIVPRARAAGAPAGWHVGVALFGGLVAGMVMNGLTVQYFLLRAQQMHPFPFRWQSVLVIASGIGGSTVVAAGVYCHLRMATRRDPDYEEPRQPLDSDAERDREPGA
jgi:MFS family permease